MKTISEVMQDISLETMLEVGRLAVQQRQERERLERERLARIKAAQERRARRNKWGDLFPITKGGCIMKERGYIYTLTEAEKNAVKYAIDYFFESVPYIMDSFTRQEAAEKASFASVVNDLQSFCDRMEGGGAGE